MIRNHRYQPRVPALQETCYLDSTSTDSSDSPRCGKRAPQGPPFLLKEKLQLCKKYIEFGYCPYRNKCKFAHGSHELRKNNQKNSLYKTKECVVFFKEGCCSYGDRCNFLHRHKNELTNQNKRQIRRNFADFFAELKQESSLLKLLE